jgi:hypothetical protein
VHRSRSDFVRHKYNVPTYDAELRARSAKVYARWGIELRRAEPPLRMTKDQLLAPLAAAP